MQVNPLYSEVSQLRAEQKKYDEAIEISKELEQLRAELSNKLASFSQADLDRLEKFIPRRLDTVRIILDLDALADRYGIALLDIAVADSTANQTQARAGANAQNTVSVSFGFRTTYAQGRQFIQEIEKSLRIFDSTNVNVRPSLQDQGIHEFRMTLKTYWINR